MAINRKGLRTITVDGHDYVWRVRANECPCCRQRSVIIADASRRGSVVLLPGPEYGERRAITPGQIAEAIRKARRRGWQPGIGTGEFTPVGGAAYNF